MCRRRIVCGTGAWVVNRRTGARTRGERSADPSDSGLRSDSVVAEDELHVDFDSPFTTWSALPTQLRSDVVTLAQSGVSHPDFRVRRLAWEWAAGVANQRTWLMFLGAAMDAFSGAAGDLRRELGQRADARAIVALGAPEP